MHVSRQPTPEALADDLELDWLDELADTLDRAAVRSDQHRASEFLHEQLGRAGFERARGVTKWLGHCVERCRGAKRFEVEARAK